MALITGTALDPKKFFEGGAPRIQGSSFDLTIGSIFDNEGKKVDGLFTIKPGHMVQVVSAEVFNLSDRVTGHVTYKTTMTKNGIWALTVGIVDPGWHSPIATTLLNFSRVDHTIAEGDAFLRVSLFEHDPVPLAKMREAPSLEEYLRDIQKTAASNFPNTFLDTEEIANKAGDKVLERVRKEALIWVAYIAFLFTVLQLVVNVYSRQPSLPSLEITRRDFNDLSARIETMQTRMLRYEQATTSVPPSLQPNSATAVPNAPQPSAPIPSQSDSPTEPPNQQNPGKSPAVPK
jgi:deoxycytidine triphosphate deaminase